MQLPYIKEIELQVNYIYLTDKLSGLKVLEKEILTLSQTNTVVYKVAHIGKTEYGKKNTINSGSFFATNKIVRNGNVLIHAFSNETYHTSIYMTDLFVVTRKSSNIYDKDCAFFSAIIDKKDENNINHKYNLLHRSLEDLPF